MQVDPQAYADALGSLAEAGEAQARAERAVTLVPPASMHDLRLRLRGAKGALTRHLNTCDAILNHPPDPCVDCERLERRVENAAARIDALASQQPERHISTTGAADRRRERRATRSAS